MTDKNSYAAGHRARLREKFMQHKLMDYEVLELLLIYAIPRIDVKPLAKKLLAKFGGVHRIITADIDELEKVPGIGRNTAIFIKAIYEIMLLDYKNYLDATPVFRDYDRLIDYCKLQLLGKQVEEFHILYLDDDYRLLSDDIHSIGTIDWAAVYPREILKRALDISARSVILLHNHPSGSSSFSSDDLEITEEIKSKLSAADIGVFDHLLVSGDIVYSAKNMFLLK
ncbi:MAG: DNA repair protein RadC [Rickettsiales bacterium]|jgi:DNA repair protein RadC|nr:DNA repair protein RadC [Rickettsiales bacterium]